MVVILSSKIRWNVVKNVFVVKGVVFRLMSNLVSFGLNNGSALNRWFSGFGEFFVRGREFVINLRRKFSSYVRLLIVKDTER